MDAGGGTIDISAYRQNPAEDTQIFEEIAPAQCKHRGTLRCFDMLYLKYRLSYIGLFEGSVFVNMYARRYLIGM